MFRTLNQRISLGVVNAYRYFGWEHIPATEKRCNALIYIILAWLAQPLGWLPVRRMFLVSVALLILDDRIIRLVKSAGDVGGAVVMVVFLLIFVVAIMSFCFQLAAVVVDHQQGRMSLRLKVETALWGILGIILLLNFVIAVIGAISYAFSPKYDSEVSVLWVLGVLFGLGAATAASAFGIYRLLRFMHRILGQNEVICPTLELPRD